MTCKHIYSCGGWISRYICNTCLRPAAMSLRLIPKHTVFSYIGRPFSIPWHLSLHLLDRVFSQSRNYDIMVLSYLAKGGLEVVYGLMNTITNLKTKTKNNITKNMSLSFYRAVYHSENHVIPNSVIAAIFEIILIISKRRKQQQYASQILQIQQLLKTIEKSLLTVIWLNFALKWRPSWTPS